MKHPFKTRIPREVYVECLASVRRHLNTNEKITNRKIREVTGINYDQAIAFFNLAIAENALIRKGLSGSTHYVLPPSKKK